MKIKFPKKNLFFKIHFWHFYQIFDFVTFHEFLPISPSKIPLYAKIAHSRSTLNYENETFTRATNFTHLIYNRMPKCGSTTIIDIIDSMPNRKFHWMKFVYPKEAHYLRNRTNDKQVMLWHTGKYGKSEKPNFLYIRHNFMYKVFSLKCRISG